jgi:hypothetical protein
MTRTRRRRVVAWVFAVVAAFALGLFLSWWFASSGFLHLSGPGSATASHPDDSFAITGDLTKPVSPGVQVPLDLTFSNSHSDSLLVTHLVVTVKSVNAPHATSSRPCTVDDFKVQQLDESTVLRLEAGKTVTLTQLQIAPEDWPQVGMVDADRNQDGCKAATLELGYSATGRIDS